MLSVSKVLLLQLTLNCVFPRPYILFANRKDIRLIELTDNKKKVSTNIIVKNHACWDIMTLERRKCHLCVYSLNIITRVHAKDDSQPHQTWLMGTAVKHAQRTYANSLFKQTVIVNENLLRFNFIVESTQKDVFNPNLTSKVKDH